jgi:hypothetical protein
MKNIEWTKCSLYIPIFKLHDVNTNHTLANNKEKHINYGNQYNTSETKENYRRIDIQSTQCANFLFGPRFSFGVLSLLNTKSNSQGSFRV